MRTTLLLAAVLAVVACSKKEDKPAEGAAAGAKPTTDPGTPAATGTTAATPPAGGDTGAAAPAAGGAGKLDCDKVLAKDLRDKYLAGAKITNREQPVDFTGECEIQLKEGDAAYNGVVNVSCHENNLPGKAKTIEIMKKNFKDMKELAGIGNPALAQDTGFGPTQVSAFDDDSNCIATLMVPKGVDAAAFTKDLLATLPLK